VNGHRPRFGLVAVLFRSPGASAAAPAPMLHRSRIVRRSTPLVAPIRCIACRSDPWMP
jgi:hypothetical protein